MPADESNALPEFTKPPVVEVVLGMSFEPIEDLRASHLGGLWERYRGEHPKCDDMLPLAPVTESFDGSKPPRLQITTVPPLLPRVWFLTADDTGIIQVQRDRFLLNWRKVVADDEYPRYATVLDKFRKHLAVFESFLAEADLGRLVPKQYELTYINHIRQGDAWTSLERLGALLPDFAWRNAQGRFLSPPEGVNLHVGFVLPDEAGRLHISIQSGAAQEDDCPLVALEFMARGMSKEASAESMWAWFDVAHEWIVRGFADLISEDVQRDVWRRTR